MCSLAFFSNIIEQPNGKCGNSFSISSLTELFVFPIILLNLPSKSYSSLALPTKSKTVKHSLLSENLNPLPNCCKNTVKLSVGLKNKIVSI